MMIEKCFVRFQGKYDSYEFVFVKCIFVGGQIDSHSVNNGVQMIR